MTHGTQKFAFYNKSLLCFGSGQFELEVNAVGKDQRLQKEEADVAAEIDQLQLGDYFPIMQEGNCKSCHEGKRAQERVNGTWPFPPVSYGIHIRRVNQAKNH